MSDPGPMLTLEETAAALRTSAATVRRWIADGRLTPWRHGHRVYIAQRDVASLASAQPA